MAALSSSLVLGFANVCMCMISEISVVVVMRIVFFVPTGGNSFMV